MINYRLLLDEEIGRLEKALERFKYSYRKTAFEPYLRDKDGELRLFGNGVSEY